MRQAIEAEWTKLRTTPGTGWLLLGAVVVTVSLSALASAAASGCPPGSACGDDPIGTSLTGVQLGQVVVAILAVQIVGGEHGVGMLRTTLVAVPQRLRVLAAKALVSGGVVLVAGLAGVGGSLVAGHVLLPEWLPLSLTDGDTLRAGAAAVAYLVLIACLSLGIAVALRDSAASIGAVLALLFLFPLVRLSVTDPDWQRRIDQISPSDAGFAVLVGWAVGSLVVGGLLLHHRDA
jgi:ABC-2 type transport system permease protein